MSFAEAANEVGRLKGVTVSPATARRRTEGDGAVYAAGQDAVAAAVLAAPPPPVAGPPVQLVSVDGAQVPLRTGEWREVRTLAIGTVGPGRQPGEVVATDLSYYCRLTDAATFTRLASGEVHRRGVETAGVVAGVVDGAPWCQAFLDAHRPGAVRILDFPHAAQRLTTAAEAVWGTGDRAAGWAAGQRRELGRGDPAVVLAALRALPVAEAADAATAAAARAEVLGYLEPRLAQLQYAAFRAQGLPIGSGVVESANKVVVEARLKGAGRRWAEDHVTPMVAWRGAVCSGRWDEAWGEVRRARRAQAAARTRARRLARRPPAPVPAPPSPQRRRPGRPAIGRLASVGPKRVVAGRPTAQHPWKRPWRPPHPGSAAEPAKL